MIACDSCNKWYHGICVGVAESTAPSTNWYCNSCDPKNVVHITKGESEEEDVDVENDDEKSGNTTVSTGQPNNFKRLGDSSPPKSV